MVQPDKEFGFIAQDVFAHFSVIEESGFRTLNENQRVQFDVAQGPKGSQATNIRPI